MVTIVCIVLIIMIVVLTAILDRKDGGNAFIGLFLGLVIGILLLIIVEERDTSIKPIDVYRGKTTLKITYRDSIAIDTVVIWKEE